MTDAVSGGWSSEVLQRRLLLGLQRARTRLAVAVASERKVITAERWNFYWETENRLRRCIKDLRARREPAPDLWYTLLGALDCLPGMMEQRFFPGDSQQLCRQLCEVLEMLEATTSSDP